MRRVATARIPAAGREVGVLAQLAAMLDHPSQAGDQLGAVAGGLAASRSSNAFLGQGTRPEQTAAGWIVLGVLVEVLGKLLVLSRWEGVGRCVGVGDGMTPCRTAPPWGIPWGCQVMMVMAGRGGLGQYYYSVLLFTLLSHPYYVSPRSSPRGSPKMKSYYLPLTPSWVVVTERSSWGGREG